jgi:hypothetical protein
MQLVAEPAQRRCWLLYRALECAPFDRAIDLARRADEFIACGPVESRHIGAVLARSEPVIAARPPTAAPPAAVPTEGIAKPEAPVGAKPEAPVGAKPTRPTIPAEQRQRLIDRLAAGAKNADLATEFGLAAKQVQGVRIGCAREIAARRGERDNGQIAGERSSSIIAPVAAAARPTTVAGSVDDVVRFLRQQDDVVVPQGSGEFLVNARFRLQLEELINRANRIRTRQGKPEFALTNRVNGHVPAANLAAANGHAAL